MTKRHKILAAAATGLTLLGGSAHADERVILDSLPREIGQFARELAQGCNKTRSGGKLDDAIEVYAAGANKRVAIFYPKRICERSPACTHEGCDIYIFAERSPGAWSTILRHTVVDDPIVHEGRGLARMTVHMSVRGGVARCFASPITICEFDLTWNGSDFTWEQAR